MNRINNSQILLCFMAFLLPAKAFAQVGCDVDLMNVHVNRAVLEARREIAINQTFITKPDSVLEYTCFVENVGSVADEIGPVFGETDAWAPRPIATTGSVVTVNAGGNPDSLDLALADAVIQSSEAYIETNFFHTYLGGTIGDIPAALPCGVMAGVWAGAKCFDFTMDDSIENKLWYQFEDLVGYDPRVFPEGMECSGTAIKQADIDSSRSANTEDLGYSIPIPYFVDYLIEAAGCNITLETGVTNHVRFAPPGERLGVIRTYPDGVCVNPGCSYQRDIAAADGEAGECLR